MSGAALLLLLLLVGCAADQQEARSPRAEPATAPPVAAAPERLAIPRALRSCRRGPAPLPDLRTPEQVTAHDAELEAALADCAWRLKRLNDLIEASQ